MNGFHLTAERVMLVSGIAVFLATVHWVRSRDLREKYAIVWLGLASLILLFGLFPGLIMRLAGLTGFSYSSAVLYLVCAVVYTHAFAVSVSATTLYRRNVRLGQELGALRERVQRVEAALAAAESKAGAKS